MRTRLLCLAGIVSLSAAAENRTPMPEVIFDSGQTVSIRPYLDAVSFESTARQRRPAGSPTPRPQPVIRLPIKTPELTPGKLGRPTVSAEVTERLQVLPQPLFVIGTDRRSRQWLADYREQLIALKAVGMLVEVATARELDAVQRAGEGLVIAPASGSELAKVLGLRHYPVLISRKGLEQ